ncbi:hypothetical protein AB0G85_37200 [Streptomyces sioyaensis]|uniref:hypothetical protein n=1 Tax=Streptomyces sioyaensis TaxID=67364 RepID=UPI003409BC5F
MLETRDQGKSGFEAIRSIGAELEVGAESLCQWVRQAEIDGGHRPGTTTEESAAMETLKRENAELKRVNEMLHAAVDRAAVPVRWVAECLRRRLRCG